RVDLPYRDVGQQLLQRGPVHVAARVAAVVVAVGQAAPAFLRLALDIRLGGLALRVQGVEFLVEPLLRRLPGVDGAADAAVELAWFGVHGLPPFGARPKKRKPLVCVPVIALATAVSEAYRWASNSKPSASTLT